jgi:7-carboxy-7-deazaguanine synthase
LLVNEIFGPTFQGEGQYVGEHCLFVRTATCNLTCKWCDTAYTWAFTPRLAEKTVAGHHYDRSVEIRTMTTEQVLSELVKLWPLGLFSTNVVISGGEPLLQDAELVSLATALAYLGCSVDVETAGTRVPSASLASKVRCFNVSPKLSHSGNDPKRAIRNDALRQYVDLANSTTGKPGAIFKFVVSCGEDIVEARTIVTQLGISSQRVYIMPEGTTAERILEVARDVAPLVLKWGYNLTLRNQILLWGNERGR